MLLTFAAATCLPRPPGGRFQHAKVSLHLTVTSLQLLVSSFVPISGYLSHFHRINVSCWWISPSLVGVVDLVYHLVNQAAGQSERRKITLRSSIVKIGHLIS